MIRIQEPPLDVSDYHPKGPFVFDPSSLKRHVRKHVIPPSQRWKDLFDPVTLRKAQKEVVVAPYWGPACGEIAQAYESLAAQQIRESLLKVATHDHHLRTHQNGKKTLGVCSWPGPRGLLYVAIDTELTKSRKSGFYHFVSPESTPTYHIRTAYRPPELVKTDRQGFRMLFWRMKKIESHQMNRFFDCPGLVENSHD